jgi:hypothetical protein
MPDRPARLLLPTVALVVLGLGAVTAPGAALGRDATDLAGPDIHQAAVPDPERCADESPDPNSGQKLCEKSILSAGNLLPIAGAVVATGILALVVAYLVLRRRASVPLAPVDPGEWWKCPNCGSTNVVGSARCYACGTWQR